MGTSDCKTNGKENINGFPMGTLDFKNMVREAQKNFPDGNCRWQKACEGQRKKKKKKHMGTEN